MAPEVERSGAFKVVVTLVVPPTTQPSLSLNVPDSQLHGLLRADAVSFAND
jgi:hypothetical protein